MLPIALGGSGAGYCRLPWALEFLQRCLGVCEGDSYDNALAESLNGLFKTEVIRRGGHWRTIEDVELATLAWVDWYNHRRLHGACDNIPPAKFETRYHQQHEAVSAA